MAKLLRREIAADITPADVERMFRKYWLRLSLLAHEIHDGIQAESGSRAHDVPTYGRGATGVTSGQTS